MNNSKYIITGAIIAIVLFLGGLFVGKYYFSKTEIKVIKETEYKTEWKTKIEYVNNQENFDALYKCYNSPISFKDNTEGNNLFVTAFDGCKENSVKYEIGTRGNWKIYAGLGVAAAIAGGIITYKVMK